MKKHLFLFGILGLFLVSFLVPPVLALTQCPSDCTCLLPAEAKKLGSLDYCSGRQAICGYDTQKNEKYCFQKTITTTGPQVLVTVKKPAVVTTVTTKPTVTTTSPTPAPVDRTVAVPATCPASCTCTDPGKAEAIGLSLCGETKTSCGLTASGTTLYCYTLPPAVIKTTTAPAARGPTEPCTAGCSCLAPDKADAVGFRQCSGTSIACDYDPLNRPMYCYSVERTMAAPLPAGTTATATTGTAIPIILPVEEPATAPAPPENIFSAIGSFIAGLFGPPRAGESTSSISQGSSTAGISFCRSRYGLETCNGICANLSTDIKNCGRCGIACYADEICCNGNCVKSTSSGNCGECGNVCPAGSPCQNGNCDPYGVCYYGNTACGNTCVDTSTDSRNCGECGNQCPDHTQCENGMCRLCPMSTTTCDGRCIFSDTDRNNCGSCRNTCTDDTICSGGACITCPAGTTRCGNTCRNLQVDNASCGACSIACPEGLFCSNGTCECPGFENGIEACPGYQSGTYVSTCVDTRNDRNNCGGCGSVGVHRCGATETCCNGNCIDINTDAENCGGCGIACGTSTTGAGFCDRQVCAHCPYGTYRCGTGSAATCQDIQSDVNNCGSCGNRCGTGETCCGGHCINPDTDRANCGSCMNACAPSEGCCNGVCRSLLFDDNNCGNCNRHCTPGRTCFEGQCCIGGYNCE